MAKRSQLPKGEIRRTPTKASAPNPKYSRGILLAVVGGVLVLMVGLVLLMVASAREPVEATGRVGEGTSWGPEGAEVTIVDYSDFGCYYCAQFAQSQGAQLRAEYELTGRVRFEFRHFIIGGPDTANAANAAECAADQGKFWDYHDVLFGRQGTSANPFSKVALKQYAAQLGLDTAQFNQCVDSDQHLEKVYRDASEGRGQGVSATPTFFVNGAKFEGAQPYNVFKAAIEAVLAGGS